MLLLIVLVVVCCTIMSDPENLGSLLVDNRVELITGHIVGEYKCLYSNVNGTLFAGSSALHFDGSYFFFDKSVTCPWEDIRKVNKMEQGIEVLLKDDNRHVFSSIHAPDRVWVLLVSLHNDWLMGRPSRITPRSHKRRNSDPLMSSTVRMLDESIVQEFVQAVDESAKINETTGAAAPKSSEPTLRSPTESFIMSTAGLNMDTVETIAGKLSLQPISCTHNDIRGKMYAGQGAIYFYGRKFFWDKQEVLLRWDMVRQIQIIDAKTAENETSSVGLFVVANDAKEYRFLKMDNADQVWATLVALQNENLTARLSTRSRIKRASVRRMNSDPLLTALDVEFTESQEELTLMDDAYRMPITSVKSLAIEREVVELLEVDDKADWEAIAQEKNYTYVVVKDHVVNCSMDMFFSLFFKDEAKFSMAKFLESRGDSNLRESAWATEGVNLTRVINYTHPVNAPMAPPTANARKEQVYRRYGEYGLIIFTKTFVDDVPLTDCFYVADRIKAKPDGPDKVLVTMEFEITFVKGTMFKVIITKTTSSEVSAVFQGLAAYMSKALGDATPMVEQAKPLVLEAPAAVKPAGTSSNVVLVLLLVILLVQGWIIVDLRQVKAAIRELQIARESNDVLDGFTAKVAEAACPS